LSTVDKDQLKSLRWLCPNYVRQKFEWANYGKNIIIREQQDLNIRVSKGFTCGNRKFDQLIIGGKMIKSTIVGTTEIHEMSIFLIRDKLLIGRKMSKKLVFFRKWHLASRQVDSIGFSTLKKKSCLLSVVICVICYACYRVSRNSWRDKKNMVRLVGENLFNNCCPDATFIDPVETPLNKFSPTD